MRGSVAALEGPLPAQVGTPRANINPCTKVVDAGGATAFLLTASGLSIVPLTGQTPGPSGNAQRPQISANGVVNNADYESGLAPGSLVTIFGQNLASSATASDTPLPTMLGGTCVTLDNSPLPLLLTSPTQINAQVPPKTTAARHTRIRLCT